MEGVHHPRVPCGTLAVVLFPVEIAVATAGGAHERFEGSFLAVGHEFSTPIGDVSSDVGCVVPEALLVADPRACKLGFGSTGTRVEDSCSPLLSRRVVLQRVIEG